MNLQFVKLCLFPPQEFQPEYRAAVRVAVLILFGFARNAVRTVWLLKAPERNLTSAQQWIHFQSLQIPEKIEKTSTSPDASMDPFSEFPMAIQLPLSFMLLFVII